MIGVVRYSGLCVVCEHPAAREITAALLAYTGARVLSEEVPELSYRDIKQHERNCLPRGTVAVPGPDEANSQRR